MMLSNFAYLQRWRFQDVLLNPPPGENMLPDKRAEFFKNATNCQIQGIDGAFRDIFSYSIDGERSIYKSVFASVLDWSGQMRHCGTPTMLLFMSKTFRNESPVEDT
ncbi:hypothetical protein ACJ73_00019 [Blastomyces percursus]|uniref:Uncharacterized protein n=1 Tax=Blastomyces percursus TaxID=1658174 RepID=A0A1J9QKI0_9EURO|nr:hypothetical protein ACJ73_00019 [Blastomyces percursus]